MKRTGWYRGDQKPVRVGVYERMYGQRSLGFCFYGCGQWSTPEDTPALAEKARFFLSGNQNLPWRGLAKEPK